MDLSHLTVLVTGGGGEGVGKGICQVLSGFGAKLVINDLDSEKVKGAVMKYPGAIGKVADISKEKEVQELFGELKNEVGPINGLVNNAGIGLSKKIYEAETKEFDQLYRVDIRAVWMLSKYFVNQLRAFDLKGNIVNISSVHALATQPRYAIYASAKAAVLGLTRGMAYELGELGIRVNAVAPGLVHSDQNYDLIKSWAEDPYQWVEDFIHYQQVLPQHIDPEDCGNTVAFLLSDYSKSITGQTIFVDAGTTVMIHNRDFLDGRVFDQ